MTTVQRVALVLAIAFLTGSLGYALGTRPGVDAPDATSADVGFLWDMIAHHEQALVVSQYQIAGGTEPRVTHFAREIVQSQSYEIGLMEGYLRMWGQPRDRPDPDAAMGWMGHTMSIDAMPGMASDSAIDELSDATGRDVDVRFLHLMKEHHRGGVEMAGAAIGLVDEVAVRDLAERIARYQRIEINELEGTRVALGLPVL